jgi:D-alanyl-D-alanine carboxypeptidase (penicillin-binding protein 5/6)
LLILQLLPCAAYSESVAANAGNAPAVKSSSAVLMDRKSGKVLYEKNMRDRRHPASLTKILTSLLILENMDSNEAITVGDEIDALEKDSSKAGFKKGQKVTAHELVWALMLPSGNDAAYTAAVHIARKKTGDASMSVKDAAGYFTEMMNTRAKQIGAADSHFANPDGYPNPDHYSTAYDMALISKEALKNSFFDEVAHTYTYVKDQSAKSQTVTPDKDTKNVWFNKNLLLNPKSNYFYQYATGIKTGYTLKAGYCLAASAAKDDLDLISVLLNADSEETRCLESKALFEYGFSNYHYRTVLVKGNVVCNVNVVRKYFGDSANINLLADADYTALLSDEEYAALEKSYLWDSKLVSPDKNKIAEVNFVGPISRGQNMGKVRYTLNGAVLAEADLMASGDALKGDFTDSVVKAYDKVQEMKFLLLGIVLFLILLVAVFLVMKKRKQRE